MGGLHHFAHCQLLLVSIARMPFAGFTFGSLNLLTSILSAAPGFLQFSKEQSSGSITPLNSAQISLFRPYTYLASTGYCHPNTIIDWSCGTSFPPVKFLVELEGWSTNFEYFMWTAHCVANKDFILTATGGDGGSVQFCKCYTVRIFKFG